MDLDLLLTFHKQQTQSLWGTRQSPSPAKPSTRLMWKSQYVPMDGIPFVNTGNLVFFQLLYDIIIKSFCTNLIFNAE